MKMDNQTDTDSTDKVVEQDDMETTAAEQETAETGQETSDGEADVQEGEKKGFFKKDKKKDKKDELIEELTDKYKRTFAEFDNYRKRTEKEKAHMYEVGAKDVIEQLLPVIDNFERGFQAISDEERTSSFAEGMDKIYKQFLNALDDIGVKEIEAEGAQFDPNLHNAVMHIEDETMEENVIAEVFRKGYTYKDSVIRHSMVKVAN